MAFQVSPGVQVREVDLTAVVPAVASTSGGFAGYFEWGPVEEVFTVSDLQELVEYFGEPGNTQATGEDFYVAESFLKYGSSLRTVRIKTTGLLTANASGDTATLIKNADDWEQNFKDGSAAATLGEWSAKYGGANGNSIGVQVCGSTTAFFQLDKTQANATLGDVEVETIAGVGGTATVTTETPHLLETGDTVDITNATNTDFNDTSVSVTVTGPSEFTYTYTGADNTENNSVAQVVNIVDQTGFARSANDIRLASGADFTQNAIIQFSNHSSKYRITSIAGDSLVIELIGAPSGTGLSQSVPSGTGVSLYWQFYDQFNKAPGTSASATLNGGSADEIHVIVYDRDGSLTGTKNTILEKFEAVSLSSDAKDSSGQTNFYKSVLERDSEWVWWTGHSTLLQDSASIDRSHTYSATIPFLRPVSIITYNFSGGSNGRLPTAGEIYGTWDDYFNNDSVDISFLIAGSTRTDDGSGTNEDTTSSWTAIVNEGIRICENRRDCLLVATPRYSDVVDVNSESSQTLNVVGTVNAATSSSYAVFDSTWVYQYDRYNDRYIWVPACGHTAGIMARTDLQRDPWYSPAGLSRGQYLGTVKIAYNPKQASRDDLYRARINPVVTFPGQGTILYGDKTGLTTPSAFDRINVRRLFIVLEKAIATAAKAQLFEFNDAFTRAQFRAAVEPFLRDVKNRRGLIDFAVLCDETNNTDSVIDRNEFVCSIFVKPARSINFITLNFVAARTGVEFEEIYSAV